MKSKTVIFNRFESAQDNHKQARIRTNRFEGSVMNRKNARGFSLMELMVVVAIVGVLAAIAYPSYTEYVTRTKRSVGTATLLRVANKQEQYYLDNKQYASDLTNLGYPAKAFFVDENGNMHAATQSGVIYEISVDRPSVSNYTLSAKPQGVQAERDARCATLTLTSSGLKGESGTGEVSDCW